MNHFSQDPYGILDIPRDATKGQIRRAYRHLAKRLHPDRNPDDPEAEERFKKLQWAYESLRGQKEQDKISSMPFERKSFYCPLFRDHPSILQLLSGREGILY